jgi:hypothetical protein
MDTTLRERTLRQPDVLPEDAQRIPDHFEHPQVAKHRFTGTSAYSISNYSSLFNNAVRPGLLKVLTNTATGGSDLLEFGTPGSRA